MKKILVISSFFLFVFAGSYSQSIRYLKNKLGETVIDKAIDEKVGKSDNTSDANNTSSSSTDRPDQKSGNGGLDASLDDVPDALTKASAD